MAAWTPAQFVALQLPPLKDPVAYNGVNTPLSSFIQNSIDQAGGSVAAALHNIFQGLAAGQIMLSETLGEYTYQKWQGLFQERARHWMQVAKSNDFSDPNMVPHMWPNDVTTMPWIATPPAWR